MKLSERMKKALSILLCLCMLMQNAPLTVFAAEQDNLCEHHPVHTADCGYREGRGGSDCTHSHSEDCYRSVACLHTCGGNCASGCGHSCTVENGCITMALDCHHTHGDCGYSAGTAEVPCGHTHNESCGYVEAAAGQDCAHSCADHGCTLNEDGETYTCIHAVHDGSCDYAAAVEGQPCNHTEHTDCGYAPASEGTPCTHTHTVKVDIADSCYKLLCSHANGGHDDACGYAAAEASHACHYECTACAENAGEGGTAEALTEEVTEPSSDATVPAETIPVQAESAPVTVHCAPEADLPDSDELFAMYAEQKLYGYDWATFGTAAKAHLNTEEQAIYEALKAKIEAVAASGGSTEFALSEVTGLKTVWTNEELGVTSIEDTDDIKARFEVQFSLDKVIRALLSDCPFDLYWYDKTRDGGMSVSYVVSRRGQTVNGVTSWTSATITNLTFIFHVVSGYQGGSSTTVTSDVTKIAAAKTKAQAIANTYSSKSDYEKLAAYKNEICSLVSYNDEAAADDYTGGYGDPWQLIYVFDGDSGTNVVCEGYAKAFQYLCDLGGLNCISVTGQMTGGTGAGGHMWNIVTLGDANYLVDVTNCDAGTVGEPDKLFLVGNGDGSVSGGYSYTIGSQIISFAYDTETTSTWTTSELTLAASDYTLPVTPATYSVSVAATTNGNVTVDKTEAAEGDTVTLTVTPAEGYELDTLTVKQGANAVTVENNKFTMPAGNVTVTATFKAHTHIFGADGKCTACGYICDHSDTKTNFVNNGDDHTYTCSCCGMTVAEAHTEETVPGYAASCTEAGLTDGKKCSVCGETLTAQEVIPAGHYVVDGICTMCEAYGICGDNLLWTLDENGLLTVSGAGNMTSHPWSSNTAKITKVIIENGVQSICTSAFEDCSNLTEVEIPGTVSTIGSSAFRYCSSLEQVVLPEGITSVGVLAFQSCGLKSVDFPESLTSIGARAFSYCTKLEAVEIPAGITQIADETFMNCTSLKKVTLPEGITSIGDYGFGYCSSLTEIELPASLTSIGDRGFAYCDQLQKIVFKGNCPEFVPGYSNKYVFNGVTATAYYPGNNATWTEAKRQGYGGTLTWVELCNDNHTFSNGYCTKCNIKGGSCGTSTYWSLDDNGLLTIYGTGRIGNSNTGTAPWYDVRTSIKKVVIKDGVTIIGNYAFYNCYVIKEVVFSESMTDIGYRAFYHCNGLKKIVLPEGITAVSEGAFANCPGLEEVVIPDSVTEIYQSAFEMCTSLNNVVLPENLTLISHYAFSGCWELAEVTFTGSVPGYISSSAFNSVEATCYYPAGDETWTEEVKQNYGGTLTWVGNCSSHEWVDATCTEPKICTICGATEGEAAGHTYEAVVTKPTCTEDGYTSYTCACGDSYVDDEVGALGHTQESIPGKEATCTTDGLTEGSHCSACGEVIVAQEVIPGGHIVVDGICTRCKVYGTCGENLTWVFDDETGTLTISGYGEMHDHDDASCAEWWYWYLQDMVGDTFINPYEDIRHIIVGSGITRIGEYAFSNLYSLESVKLPAGLQGLGAHAFGTNDNQLYEITLPSTLVCIEEYALFGSPITSITIPENTIEIAPYALPGVVKEITFLGNAPSVISKESRPSDIPLMSGIKAAAYYPANNYTWTKEIMQSYGGDITWICESCRNGHIEVIEKAVDATCTTDGLTEGKHCSACGEVLEAQVTIPALGHAYENGFCKNCGEKDPSVPVSGTCGEDLTWEFDAATGTLTVSGTGKMSDYSRDASNPAPWEVWSDQIKVLVLAEGVTKIGDFAFANCKALRTITFTGNAPQIADNAFNGVTATAYYPANDPTWTVAVMINYGGTLTWVANCPGHEWAAATCTEPKTCTVCGETEGEAAGHNYEAVVTKPTCTEGGYTTYTCFCGDSYVGNKVGALGHTQESIPGKEATCTEPGLTEGKHCPGCGDVIVKQEVIPAGHTEVIDEAVDATCSSDGLTEGKHCSACGEVFVAQEVVPAHGVHEYVIVKSLEPSSTEPGYVWLECSCCGAQKNHEVEQTAGEHAYVVVKELKATCIEPGYVWKECIKCGAEKNHEVGEATGVHNYVTVKEQAPTSTEPGLTGGKQCSVCGEVLATQ